MPATALRVATLTTLAMLAFAANSLICRVALRDTAIDAGTFTAVRLAAGALVLIVVLRLRGLAPTSGGSWPAAAMLFGYAAFFSFAYRDLTAATGALLLFGAVQLTMSLWGLARGERPGLRPLAGLTIAMGGLVWLLLPGLSAPPVLGAACMIAAGAAWGAYSILGRGGGDPVAATAGNFVRSVPFAAVLMLAGASTAEADLAGAAWAALSGAVTSGLGYVIWYAALPFLRPVQAATVQLSVPAIAALGGIALLAEPFDARLIAASAAILGGIALAVLPKRS
ncbi:MAG: DMT family transporter [Alphaproteobacteria bacterium]|nr:DMT family transporter [Alphaproteobacteria bacterium]